MGLKSTCLGKTLGPPNSETTATYFFYTCSITIIVVVEETLTSNFSTVQVFCFKIIRRFIIKLQISKRWNSLYLSFCFHSCMPCIFFHLPFYLRVSFLVVFLLSQKEEYQCTSRIRFKVNVYLLMLLFPSLINSSRCNY